MSVVCFSLLRLRLRFTFATSSFLLLRHDIFLNTLGRKWSYPVMLRQDFAMCSSDQKLTTTSANILGWSRLTAWPQQGRRSTRLRSGTLAFRISTPDTCTTWQREEEEVGHSLTYSASTLTKRHGWTGVWELLYTLPTVWMNFGKNGQWSGSCLVYPQCEWTLAKRQGWIVVWELTNLPTVWMNLGKKARIVVTVWKLLHNFPTYECFRLT